MDDDNILDDFKQAARFIKSVEISNESLVLEYKNGKTESHSFDDMKKVSIITTDEGPMQDDVFWLMLFNDSIIMVPQGIAGEDKLLSRLQKLPGFDNDEVIRAMQCTDNNAFHVWE